MFTQNPVARACAHALTRAKQVRTLRGVGGHILYLEEAAHCEEQVVNEVILPLLLMKDSCLICISTPLGTTNFYSVWATRRNDRGRLMFNVVNADEPCPRCVAADRGDKCPHKVREMPAFRPPERVEKVKALMSANPTLVAREVYGKISDAEFAAFSRAAITRMLARGNVTPPGHARVGTVYMSMDPNGGASGHSETGSFTAFVSLYYEGANVSVRTASASYNTSARNTTVDSAVASVNPAYMSWNAGSTWRASHSENACVSATRAEPPPEAATPSA